MKKTYILLLIVTCLSFVSCTHTKETAPKVTKNPYIYETSDCIYISDYDTYLEYMEEHGDILEVFVPYDKIKDFGEFESFEIILYGIEYNYHKYVLRDSTGRRVIVTMKTEPLKFVEPLAQEKNLNLNSMERNMSEDWEVFIYQGIHYYYTDGHLSYIAWEHEGITYRFSSDLGIFYPDSPTLTCRLLNAYEAPKIIASIMEPDNTDATE